MGDAMRWFITKRHLVALIGLLVAAMLAMAITGCIPVTIRPEFDDRGDPKAIPVTVAGAQDLATGVFHPVYPVSEQAPTPPAPFPWETILQVALGVLGVGSVGGAGVAVRVIGKLRTAVRISSDLADAQARAETDEDVERNKMIARHQQEQAGVRSMTQKARGK